MFCCCLLAVVEGTASISQLSLKYPGRVVCLQQRGSKTKTHNRGKLYQNTKRHKSTQCPPPLPIHMWTFGLVSQHSGAMSSSLKCSLNEPARRPLCIVTGMLGSPCSPQKPHDPLFLGTILQCLQCHVGAGLGGQGEGSAGVRLTSAADTVLGLD